MELTFTCHHCQQNLTVPATATGQMLPCPHCGEPLTVPRPKIRFKSRTESPAAAPADSPTAPCPKCRAPMPADAVLCIQCGWDSRSNTTSQTRVQKHFPWRAIVATVALVTIAAAGWSIWKQLHPPPPRPLAPPPSSRTTLLGTVKPITTGTIYTDDWQVVSCRLTAEPATVSNQPAIQIRVQLQATVDTTLPALWPGAVAVEVLRAESPTGPFKTILIQGEPDVRRPTGSSDGRYVVNGVTQPRRRYQYGFTDTNVTLGRRYIYKLRFADGKAKPIIETGYCSTLPLPVAILQTNQTELTWQFPPASTNGLLAPPQHRLALPEIHELHRGGWSAGKLTLPQPPPGPIESRVTGLICADEWDLQLGQLTSTSERSVQQVLGRPGRRPEGIICRVATGPQPFGQAKETPAGSGTQRINWELNDRIRLLTFEIRGQLTGTQRWSQADKSIYNLGGYTRLLEAGLSERVECLYTWPATVAIATTNTVGKGFSVSTRHESTGAIATARVELVRSPLPPPLSVAASDKQVTLAWPRLVYDPVDWVDGPWLVLRRYSGSGVKRTGNQLQFLLAEEIFRGPASTTTYTDRAVTNGTTYYYTLDIAGATRATTWTLAGGAYDCILPVDVRSEVAANQPPLPALPEPAHSLRLAFVADAAGWNVPDPRASRLQAHCLRALRRTPWLEVRDHAAPVVLRWRIRQVQYDRYFDVWLDDPARQRKTRVLSQPLTNCDPAAVSRQLIAALAAAFPAANPAASTPDGAIRTLTVTGFQPLSKETLPAQEFDTALVARLAKAEGLRLVSREQTPDAQLTGFYHVENGTVTVSARLRDTGTGEIGHFFELTGARGELDSLVSRLTTQIRAAAKEQSFVTDSPLQRWLETQAATRGAIAAAPPPPAETGTPEFHYERAQQQQAAGNFAEALASYRTGLALAEKAEDPWRFYPVIGTLLTQLNRCEERIALWQRAVANRESRHDDPVEALRELARSYQQCGRPKEAGQTLDKLPPERHDYAIGRDYEAAGRTNAAIDVYGRLVWKATSPFSREEMLGPGYAALIRLLETGPAEIQIAVLKQIIQRVGDRRPQQSRRALNELKQLGVTYEEPGNNRSNAGTALETVIADQPETLEALRARLLLANRARMQRDEPAFRRHLEEIIASKLTGQEADRLRMMAKSRLQSPLPPPPSGAPPATDAPRESFATVGADRLLVDTAAVVYRVNEPGEVVWKFDPQARPVATPRSSARFAMPGQPSPTQLYEAATGSRHWYNSNYRIDAYITDLRLLAGAMLRDAETLYAPNLLDGTLTALDLSTGQPRWTFVAWAPLTRPVLVAGKLWVGDSLGGVWQLNAADGRIVSHTPARHGERNYTEQLLQLNVDESAHRLSFINPRYTGNYRTAAGLQRFEFESHNLDLNTLALTVHDIAGMPLGQIPATAQLENGTIRVGTAAPEKPAILQPRPALPPREATLAQAQNRSDREPAVPGLLEILNDMTAAPQQRATAVRALSEICGIAFVPRLARLENDPVPAVRRAALAGLAWLGADRHREVLRWHLTDEDAGTRQEAIAGLVRHDRQQARALADSRYRVEILTELVKAGDRESIPLLKREVGESELLTNEELLVALCRADDPAALLELRRRFDWSRATTAPLTTAALLGAQLPEPRFGNFLRDVFTTSERWGTRAAYAPGLAALGDPHSIPALIGALAGRTAGNPAIILALEDLAGESFGDNRVRWEQWWQTATTLRQQAAQPAVPQVKPAPTWSIHSAASTGDLERVKELLTENPDLLEDTSDVGGTGMTPLLMAASSGKLDVVKYLIERGANLEAQLWISGSTTLLIAFHSNRPEVARLLIEKGAKVDVRDKMGRTPLKYATDQKHQDLIKLLRDRGAQD